MNTFKNIFDAVKQLHETNQADGAIKIHLHHFIPTHKTKTPSVIELRELMEENNLKLKY